MKLNNLKAVAEAPGHYQATGLLSREDILAAAQQIAQDRLARGRLLDSPTVVADYLRPLLGHLEHEVFMVIFLDSQHRVIARETLFTGTVNAANVWPREVVKRVLHHNAAAVILAHNHPSGVVRPSAADRQITKRIQDALELVGTQVLDHLIVSFEDQLSFAQEGLL